MKLFVDTNVFYSFLFETEFTEKAKNILLRKDRLFTSFTVMNELIYVVLRKVAEKKFSINSYHEFRSFISENGYKEFEDEIEKILELIDDINLVVLPDYQNYSFVLEIMKKYRLLPNDALIVSTCRYYGISKIATFDRDFRRVDFIEVVE